MSWWDKYPHRLQTERMLMAERFPQFQLAESKRHEGLLAWQGWLRTNYGTVYWIEIIYGKDYPHREPKTYVLRPQLVRGTPHMYLDRSLCVHVHPWQPDSSTAVALVPVAAEWLFHYDRWRLNGCRGRW